VSFSRFLPNASSAGAARHRSFSANAPLAEIQGFWRAYIDADNPVPANRAPGLHSHLTGIKRALSRYHDDAPHMIEWKFGQRYPRKLYPRSGTIGMSANDRLCSLTGQGLAAQF
jgi:hypothetical protein